MTAGLHVGCHGGLVVQVKERGDYMHASAHFLRPVLVVFFVC